MWLQTDARHNIFFSCPARSKPSNSTVGGLCKHETSTDFLPRLLPCHRPPAPLPPPTAPPLVGSLALSPEIPNFAYLISAAYFFATGGGYDKLEVYKCSDGVKAPAVTREMVIRFPSCMVSWRHKEFHMVIQMLHLNLLLVSTPELSSSTELDTRLVNT